MLSMVAMVFGMLLFSVKKLFIMLLCWYGNLSFVL